MEVDASMRNFLSSTTGGLSQTKEKTLTLDQDLSEESISFFAEVTAGENGESVCLPFGVDYIIHKSPEGGELTDPSHEGPFHDQERRPEVTLGGLSDGDQVFLYHSSGCAQEDLVGSGGTSGGQGVIRVNTDLDFVTHHFHAKSVHQASAQESSCVDIGVSYEILQNPSPPSFDANAADSGGMTPTIRVSSLNKGDRVLLYKDDASCKSGSGEIARGK